MAARIGPAIGPLILYTGRRQLEAIDHRQIQPAVSAPSPRTPLDFIPPVIPSFSKHSPRRRISVSLRFLGNSSTLLGFRRHTALFWHSGTASLDRLKYRIYSRIKRPSRPEILTSFRSPFRLINQSIHQSTFALFGPPRPPLCFALLLRYRLWRLRQVVSSH